MRSICTVAALAAVAGSALAAAPAFRLTILHHSDGESQLLNSAQQPNFGGVARFKTLVDQLKAEAVADPMNDGIPRGVVLISAGDNFLAGPEFQLSLNRGVPFYDAIAQNEFGYDAMTIGNHEFDFNPDVLQQYILSFTNPPPFISANLGFANEPGLAGRIVPSTVVDFGGTRVGIVGATTDGLASISSPRFTEISPVLPSVRAEVMNLVGQGVEIIILSSHLQGIAQELALVPQINNVDVVIAGGGSELLANPGNLLVPGDTLNPARPYPLTANDEDGTPVPVVGTADDYGYIGRLIVDFDADGNVCGIDPQSGPVRVSGVAPDAVTPDAFIAAEVTAPVQAGLATLAANVIAQTEVPLNGRRASVRTVETNVGNLVADAFLQQARTLADEFGAPLASVAFANSGGIRNDSIIPVGNVTELNTFDILPFSNFLSVVPSIPAAQFKELMENAVSRVEFSDGRFAQIAGFRMKYDRRQQSQTLDAVTGAVTRPGNRVRQIVLSDGTVLVRQGQVVPGAPAVNVATIDFLARGGDSYPFRGAFFNVLGVSYQQALFNYITGPLGGVITAQGYADGGEGRIIDISVGFAAADFDDNGVLDIFDLFDLLAAFDANAPEADINADGLIDIFDLFTFLELLDA